MPAKRTTGNPSEVDMRAASKASFTRPADTTAYTIGDLIANNTTAGSVTPLSFTGATKTGDGGTGRVGKLIIQKTGNAAATIRAWFMKTSHAVTNGDNGALVFTSLDLDNCIGFMDVALDGTNDDVGASGALVNKSYDAPLDYELTSGDTIYVFLQALTAYTPGNAEVYTVKPFFEVFA